MILFLLFSCYIYIYNTNMTSKRNVLGEGTFGCVLKPSIRCINKKYMSIDYTGKISKLMTLKNATDELKEYNNIKHIDNIYKYVVEPPILCDKPDKNQINDAIKLCKNKDFHKKDAKLAILIQKMAGIDLVAFITDVLPTISNYEKLIFWKKSIQLIKGIEFFVKKNIVHHDIKLNNIVYNIKNHEFKFIDLGKMSCINKLITLGKKNNQREAQEWFNYPDGYYGNKSKYEFKSILNYKQYPFDKSWIEYVNKLYSIFDLYGIKRIFTNFADYVKPVGVNANFFKEVIEISKPGKTIWDHNSVNNYLEKMEKLIEQYINPLIQSTPKTTLSAQTNNIYNNNIITSFVNKSPSANKSALSKKILNKTVKRKRCPNGSNRNKTTGKCDRKSMLVNKSKTVKTVKTAKVKYSRCPNGHRRNKITHKCDKKNNN